MLHKTAIWSTGAIAGMGYVHLVSGNGLLWPIVMIVWGVGLGIIHIRSKRKDQS